MIASRPPLSGESDRSHGRPRSQAMPEPKTISIVEGGQRWSAAYESDGKAVCVMSAYGSERAPVKRQAVSQAAEAAFRRIIQRRLGGAA